MKKSYVLDAFVHTPWAILPRKLAVLEEIVTRHVNGERLDAEEVQARIHGARRPSDQRITSQDEGVKSAVAVLPLFGVIFPRANLMTEMSGATSAEMFGAQFARLVNDPGIGAIVLDVDSPGGQVGGIDELSAQIFNARGTKPIVAVANHTMASAAYWIGTSADEVVVSPSSEVGSIGVFAEHDDFSGALEKDGIKVSLISAGKYKVEANPYEPLGEEARDAIQERVDEYYEAFVESVARNRGTKPAIVRKGYGEGRMVGARRAVEEGMADRIGTLDETIKRLLSNLRPELAQANSSVDNLPEMASSDPARTVTYSGSERDDPSQADFYPATERGVLVPHEDGALEAQAQRLRDDVNQYLQEKKE